MNSANNKFPQHFRLQGARFWSANPADPWATFLDIKDGRICAVGSTASNANAFLPPAQTPPVTITLPATAVVTPGLIDAHLHLSLGAATLQLLDLSRVSSRASFEAAITAAAKQLTPGRYLHAFGWHEANWGGEQPTRAWLSGAGDTPCVAYRMDQHACVVNDALLKQIANIPCPDGGTIVCDQHGNPTGLLLEQAAWQLINPRIPALPAADRRNALLAACAHCNSFGITTVGSMEYQRDLEEVHDYLRKNQREHSTLRIRATILDREWPVDFAWGSSFKGDELLAIVGWKSFIDGTLGSRTARMHAPYSGNGDNRGMLVEFAATGIARLRAWAEEVIRIGFSPSMHAIGDEAMQIALDALEPIDHAKVARFEHCQTMADADLRRMSGRIASMQPLHKADDARIALSRLGEHRMHQFFRFRDLLAQGARLAFGSDWPIVSCDPRLGIRAAVTGLDFNGHPCRTEQNLSVTESLHAYTSGAADALRAPDLGRLIPGAHADLCIFQDDPFTCDWTQELPSIAATILAGCVVHGNIEFGVASSS